MAPGEDLGGVRILQKLCFGSIGTNLPWVQHAQAHPSGGRRIESPTGGHRRPPLFFQRVLKRVVSFSVFWLWRGLGAVSALLLNALGLLWGKYGCSWNGSWVVLGALGWPWGLLSFRFLLICILFFGKSSRCTKLPSTEGRKGGTESFWGVPGAQKALLALRFQGQS